VNGRDSVLRLACIDADAPPLFGPADAEGNRDGFEPAVARLVAEELGRRLEWAVMPWNDMLPSVRRHDVDAVLCGQGIIPSRQEQVDFTRPYGVFHEGVLVRRGEGVRGPADLVGKRVAAIADSANMALANTFTGAAVVPFGGDSDDVYGEMLAALRSGEVDAVVDDDVVFVPLDESDPTFELAFTVQTGNRWGIGVAKDRPDTLTEIDGALAAVVADGRHRQAWEVWLPTLEYPFGETDHADFLLL
jgi:polar amino acid transport system substrate-binding protein